MSDAAEPAFDRRAEVERLLEQDETVLGRFWHYEKEGLSREEMQEAEGTETAGWTYNYRSVLGVLRDGDVPSAPSRALQGARRIRTWLKLPDLSPQLRQALIEQESLLMSRAQDREAQEEEVGEAVQKTKAAEAAAGPGIYVYTLPHYLRYPYEADSGRTLLKIGHSARDAVYRATSQGKLTALREDPILLRVYPVEESAKAEAGFHEWLRDADHAGNRSLRGGSEWFVKKEGNPDTRKVVAQLLDYAAALWGLSVDEFERRTLRGTLGDEDPRRLDEFIMEELVPRNADDPAKAAETVVDALGETLQTGDFTLVLAAPTVPPDVQRVIEYLNTRGHSVFGLEVSYFSGEVEAFVPRIVVRPHLGGPGGTHPEPWDEDSFLREIEDEHGAEEAHAARELIDWAGGQKLRPKWGAGTIEGSFKPVLEHAGKPYHPFTIVTARGKVEIPFDYMTRPPFNEFEMRHKLRRLLNEISGVSIGEDEITSRPGIPLSLFAADPDALEKFTGAFDWYCETVRSEAQGR